MPPYWIQRRAEEARDQVRKSHDHRRQYGMINQMSAALYEKEVRAAEIEAGYREHDLWLFSHST
jgi:hypothetical protein